MKCANGRKPRCKFWGTTVGCKRGESCSFQHSWEGLVKKGRCWNCSAEGHMKPDCPFLKSDGGTGSPDKTKVAKANTTKGGGKGKSGSEVSDGSKGKESGGGPLKDFFIRHISATPLEKKRKKGQKRALLETWLAILVHLVFWYTFFSSALTLLLFFRFVMAFAPSPSRFTFDSQSTILVHPDALSTLLFLCYSTAFLLSSLSPPYILYRGWRELVPS